YPQTPGSDDSRWLRPQRSPRVQRHSRGQYPGLRPPARHPAPWSDLRLGRSEEHTSELQSRENLVCRLLLEKKKAKATPARRSRIMDSHSRCQHWELIHPGYGYLLERAGVGGGQMAEPTGDGRIPFHALARQ